MPQPIKKINLKIDPQALAQRPELAAHIAIISSQWATVENRLAHIFALVMEDRKEISKAVLAEVTNVRTRLEMITRALEQTAPPEFAERFRTLYPDILKRAGERARTVHAIWCIHEDFPDYLIRFEGEGDPTLKIDKYSAKDFQEIELRLLDLELALTDYWRWLGGHIVKHAKAVDA